jgi:hypothetical protein
VTMYGSDDPRSKLGAAGGAPALASTPYADAGRALKFAAAEYVRFHELPPRESGAKGRTWYARGQNFVVSYSEATPGTVLSRDAQVDEYFVLVPERGVEVTIATPSESRMLAGHSLVIVPPGRSAVTVKTSGTVIRVFSAQSADLAALAANAGSYARAHPNIPPYEPWPAPPDGFRIRTYDLDVAPKEGRFGRLWRCSTLMINVLPLEPGPRDRTRLSPHFHEDFEQGSLALRGAFTHHIRWPWTANLGDWRADDHEDCPAPSLAVIPPPAIHTSAGSDPVMNQLVDIFSPPRIDFSKMPGWVLNADEYPMPQSGP